MILRLYLIYLNLLSLCLKKIISRDKKDDVDDNNVENNDNDDVGNNDNETAGDESGLINNNSQFNQHNYPPSPVNPHYDILEEDLGESNEIKNTKDNLDERKMNIDEDIKIRKTRKRIFKIK